MIPWAFPKKASTMEIDNILTISTGANHTNDRYRVPTTRDVVKATVQLVGVTGMSSDIELGPTILGIGTGHRALTTRDVVKATVQLVGMTGMSSDIEG